MATMTRAPKARPFARADSDDKMSPRLRHWLSPGIWTLAVVVLLLAAVHLGGGWYFASQIEERGLSAEARRAALVPNYTVDVVAVEEGTITLRKPGDRRLEQDGTFGLTWEGGWGIIRDIVRREPGGAVVREFQHRAGRPLAPGDRAAIDTRVFAGDPETGLGIAFDTVTYPGSAGPLSAWFIPGRGTTWYVFVHGNGMTQRDGLRFLPVATGLGLPALVITYRGDEGAPEPDRTLTYGKDEWHDLEAAIAYAREQGAERVILHGVSMGGAVVAAFLLESPLADVVSGVVLDSPVLDFERAVDHQASDESIPLVGLPLPGSLVASAKWLAEIRFGVDWDFTNYLAHARELRAPILLIHGTEDDSVPLATSADLARLRPDLVRDFYVVEGAGHVESWNREPAEYERRLRAFIDSLSSE